jgi:Domain found in Dishevelled, Egl-10, and Pleckstrin (DEP)
MLLKSQDVSYCQLVRQFGNTSEIVRGVSYKGNVFVRGNSFPKQQRQVAITEMRRNFLDPEPVIACLLVEDGDIVTIWHEDRYITKIATEPADIIKYFSLAQLVAEMRSKSGVKIEDRAQSFRFPYRRCLIGREAVDWMTKRLSIDRADAVALGVKLIDENWLKNLSNKQSFGDDELFYQFCMDK